MKKSLVALAVLAAAGAASAQSSVTLFGVVDATLSYGAGSGAGGSSRHYLGNSGYNSSRLGFRGTEDLGGGMAASFWLEAGVNNDNGTGASSNTNNQGNGGVQNTCAVTATPAIAGTALACTVATQPNGSQGLTFNRRSTVSLSGRWGEVRLGRDYSPQFWNLTIFDPFGTNGVGTTQTLNGTIGTGTNPGGPVAVRASNTVGYFLPGNIGGFYGQLQYYRGENLNNGAANEDDGTGYAGRIGFANGPVNLAFAYSDTEYATAAAAGDIKQYNVGGQWDFGFAKLIGHYDRAIVDTAVGQSYRGFLGGALVPIGAGEVRLAYSQSRRKAGGTTQRARKIALGYVHNLSRRTALYTTAAYVRNTGGATAALNQSVVGANNNSRGFDFGIRHSF